MLCKIEKEEEDEEGRRFPFIFDPISIVVVNRGFFLFVPAPLGSASLRTLQHRARDARSGRADLQGLRASSALESGDNSESVDDVSVDAADVLVARATSTSTTSFCNDAPSPTRQPTNAHPACCNLFLLFL